jgi:hypothetical protein
MLSPRFKPWHLIPFALKYARLRLTRRPVLVNFEVTMRCNAACGGCDYWQTPASEKAHELKSFADAARAFDPMMITFTGGEPTLRRDLEEIVAEVARAVPYCYMSLLTHGGMLTLDRAQALADAGLAQFSISLDYLDERHDAVRGIPGWPPRSSRSLRRRSARGVAVRFKPSSATTISTTSCPSCGTHTVGAGVNLSVYTDMEERQHGPSHPRRPARARAGARERSPRLQARAPRRHHQLRLVPAPAAALPPRRDARAVPVGRDDDSH